MYVFIISFCADIAAVVLIPALREYLEAQQGG